MKHRATSIFLSSALGLGGLMTGVVLAPAVAVAATEEGTSTADAVSDRVSRIAEALSGLVGDGTITQQQADAVATTLADTLPRGGHGPGGPGGGRHLEAAAEALGTTAEELRTALEGGRSLADVAAEKGMSTDALVEALVEAAKAHLAEHVADGSLTQEQADARAAELTERITDLVEREGLPARPGHGGAPDDGSTGSS